MNREEILERSRKEYQNRDFAELDVVFQAGNIAGRVGACVCCLVSLLTRWITRKLPYSPWVIYFSILGTHYLVKFSRLKQKSDLALAVVYYSMGLLAFALFMLRLVRVKG